jgi:ribosomal-protein-alanine N-acetyltransferase
MFEDLPAIAQLDAETFEPLWVNSLASIEQAYLQSEYATVAEKNQQIVGFQITTQNTFSAHLGRLAVTPAQQGQGIGMALLHDMLTHFQRIGIFKVGVNTQSTNQQSLRLYQRAGFVLTGVSFPVYTRKVNS